MYFSDGLWAYRTTSSVWSGLERLLETWRQGSSIPLLLLIRTPPAESGRYTGFPPTWNRFWKAIWHSTALSQVCNQDFWHLLISLFSPGVYCEFQLSSPLFSKPCNSEKKRNYLLYLKKLAILGKRLERFKSGMDQPRAEMIKSLKNDMGHMSTTLFQK
jgi:hypothetical protein